MQICEFTHIFNCTEAHFLAIIFACYTLYSPITKNEPTTREKRKLKAKRNIPRWNTQEKDNVEKKKPGRQGGASEPGQEGESPEWTFSI